MLTMDSDCDIRYRGSLRHALRSSNSERRKPWDQRNLLHQKALPFAAVASPGFKDSKLRERMKSRSQEVGGEEIPGQVVESHPSHDGGPGIMEKEGDAALVGG